MGSVTLYLSIIRQIHVLPKPAPKSQHLPQAWAMGCVGIMILGFYTDLVKGLPTTSTGPIRLALEFHDNLFGIRIRRKF